MRSPARHAERVLLLHALLMAGALLLLAGLMHRPVPHLIEVWDVAGPWWTRWVDLLPDTRWAARLALAGVFATCIVVHLSLLVRCRGRSVTRGGLGVVVGGTVALSLIPALAPRTFSSDASAYIMYGRVAAIHGANPMAVAPEQFPTDPFLSLMEARYRDSVSVYGPVWNAVSAALTRCAEVLGGQYGTYEALYRAVTLAGLVASVAALWFLLGIWRPRMQLVGTLLFAWNPLTLIEASAIHNDFVMLGLMGWGMVLLARARPAPGVVLLVAAALVKWVAVVPVVLVCVAIVASPPTARARVRTGVELLVLVASLCLLAFLPFGHMLTAATAPFSAAGAGAVNSFAELAAMLLPRLPESVPLLGSIPPDSALVLSQWVSKVLCGAALVVGCVATWRRPTVSGALSTSGAVLLALALLAPRFWPWYALWPLLLAAVSSLATRRGAHLLSYTALGVYVIYPVPGASTLLTSTRAVWILGPVVAIVLLTWWRAPVRKTHPDPVAVGPLNG